MKLIPYFKKIVIDITYIHVRNEGWTYIASVMDLYDRKIIDWAYGKNITAELAVNFVRNIYLNIPDTKGIILHSDLGSQYISEKFEVCLKELGIRHSFSRKGNSYDNACIESFHFVLVHLVWWTSEVLTPFDIVVRCFTERRIGCIEDYNNFLD